MHRDIELRTEVQRFRNRSCHGHRGALAARPDEGAHAERVTEEQPGRRGSRRPNAELFLGHCTIVPSTKSLPPHWHKRLVPEMVSQVALHEMAQIFQHPAKSWVVVHAF